MVLAAPTVLVDKPSELDAHSIDVTSRVVKHDVTPKYQMIQSSHPKAVSNTGTVDQLFEAVVTGDGRDAHGVRKAFPFSLIPPKRKPSAALVDCSAKIPPKSEKRLLEVRLFWIILAVCKVAILNPCVLGLQLQAAAFTAVTDICRPKPSRFLTPAALPTRPPEVCHERAA